MPNKYTDKAFPANLNSIFSKGKKSIFAPTITWRRLEDMVPLDTDLIKNTSAEDIVQGNVGDCWLLASLAAIADHKKFLRRVFNTKKVNSEGRYSFTFNVDGLDRIVEVDSLLPVLSDGLLYSARAHHGHYWVALAEKAMAKSVGGYDRLEAGDCEEALRGLTGCPTNTFEENLPLPELWKGLQIYGTSKSHLLTCGIDSDGMENLPKFFSQELPNGLLMDHVYTVLDVKEHTPTGTKLIKLRNPWGKSEFQGDWSDYSNKWNDSLRNFFGCKADPNDGVFFISFEEFAKWFNVISYCDTTDDWKVARIKGTFTKNDVVEAPTFLLNLPHGKITHFAIHQQDERVANAKKHVDTGAIIIDQKSKKAVAILDFKLKRCTQKELSLPEGKYHVVPYSSGVHFGEGEENQTRDFVLSVHSSGDKLPTLKSIGIEKGRSENVFALALTHLCNECQSKGGAVVRQLSSRDLIAVGLQVLPDDALDVVNNNVANSNVVDNYKADVNDNAPGDANNNSIANYVSDKNYLFLMVDTSESTNIVPTLNSMESMKPVCLRFKKSDGMYVAKFIRSGDEAYEFSFNCQIVDTDNATITRDD